MGQERTCLLGSATPPSQGGGTPAFPRLVIKLDVRNIEWFRERTEHLDIFLFPSIAQWCSISDVLFTGGRGVSDFYVLKYY